MLINTEHTDLIELTHPLTNNIPQWDTSCGFHQTVDKDYQDCKSTTKFRVQSLQMPAGVGTHIDSPAHCIPTGMTVDNIPLTSLIVPCCVLNVSDKADANYLVSAEDIYHFEKHHGEIPSGNLFIIYTGWSRYWNQPEKYRNELLFPAVSIEAANYLLERDIVGLAIDTLSPDTAASGFPVHQLFLGAGKYLIENIANAKQLNATGDYVIILPMFVQDATEAPVRIIGLRGRD